MTPEITPWAGMMRQALAAGIEPAAFWRLSLKEWRMLQTAPEAGSAAMGRGALERLTEAWPDDR